MATSNHTGNYNFSQYAATDPVKFLTNYNQDMAAIDAAIKAASDSAAAKAPLTRTIAGLSLSADLTLAQLTAAGLASGDNSGNANNALKLGGVQAANFAQVSSGTWTPTIFGETVAGSPVYTEHDGEWVKIGNMVFIVFTVYITSKGGMTGNLHLGGLPFSASKRWGGGLCSFAYGLPTSTYGVALFGTGGTDGYLTGFNSTGTGYLAASSIGDGFGISYGHAVYPTN